MNAFSTIKPREAPDCPIVAGKPTVTISLAMPLLSLKPLKSGLILFFLPNSISSPAPAKSALDIKVAQAAPAMPMFNVKIKMGSRMTLIMAEAPLKIMGVMVLPCACMIELILK